MSLLLDSTIKVSFLVLFALAGSAVLRKQSAAVRHWVLSAALACAAAIPVLAVVVPPWSLPLSIPLASQLKPAPTTGLSIEIQVVERPNQPGDRAVLPQEASAPVQGPGSATFRIENVSQLVTPIWIAGVAVSLSILIVGLAQLAWLASRSQRIVDGAWAELAEDVARQYGLRRPIRLLESGHPTLLVTWGLARPKLILPAGADAWTKDRIHASSLMSSPTYGVATGPSRWSWNCCGPSTGSTRFSGSLPGVCRARANTPVTTPC